MPGENAWVLAFPDEPVSPELALVDPVLRERLLRESLQKLLHERTDVRLAPKRETPGLLEHTGPAQSAHPATRRGRPDRLLASVLWVGALTLLLAVPSLAFLPPRNAPQLGRQAVPSRREIVIAWQPDSSADYYVFELLSGGRLVTRSPVQVPSVALGAAIPPGLYAWRVFVGRGPTAARNTQGPTARGTVTLE